ncbi:golgin subfamily A member 5 isoform X2 [Hyposmocoma kahamanoa]|uniref:golgin subfamily A member 5 isoform X2 n=1 Tax=Hyposmocoma kahamanoa TaxID=1477025 RepID=UPI000E6D70C5|nr:golgin subfamily A member 5 isoform X2 [Hyposmocoma kahamanoa]
MSWFADLAGKAEHLLNNLDEQTGVVLRNHSVTKSQKKDRNEYASRPDRPWNQSTRKQPIARSPKKLSVDVRASYVPTKNLSPTFPPNSQSHTNSRCFTRNGSPPQTRKTQFNLHNCPRTLVGDVKDGDSYRENYGYKPSKRRFSLPNDLDAVTTEDSFSIKLENLEVENAMLKNELNVTNRELGELLERLRKTEDELLKTNTKLESCEVTIHKTNVDKETLSAHIENLKIQINNLTNVEIAKYKDLKRELEMEVTKLKERNVDLEELARLLNEKSKEKESCYTKLENDLRHAHSAINVLQSDLLKSNDECKRLEKEWEGYKHRVKSMLAAKDKEIKSMKHGIQFNEDTKVLMDKIESVNQERDVLSEAVARVRGEYQDLKQYVENLESRHNNAERVVVALRDALKDERSARTRVEAQCNGLAKELKCLQIESGQTIASLRSALREKDNELRQIRDSSSTSKSNSINLMVSGALNVADYDCGQDVSSDVSNDATCMHDSEHNEKIYYLSQKLVQRQSKIDSLLAENNCVKIQLKQLQSKCKKEEDALRTQHSVVQLQDHHGHRSRSTAAVDPTWVKLSKRMGVIMRRFPLLRVFFIAYLVSLHFLVLTVLLSTTPDVNKPHTYYKSKTYPLGGAIN